MVNHCVDFLIKRLTCYYMKDGEHLTVFVLQGGSELGNDVSILQGERDRPGFLASGLV